MTSSEIMMYASAAVCILLAFLFAVKVLLPKTVAGRPTVPGVGHSAMKARIPCVLCGALLGKGEKLHSKEIIRKDDSLVHMYGCPYCHGLGASRAKTCPVCKKPVAGGEYLIGRMWVRKNGKKHLHIAGCVRCAHL